MQTEIFMLVYSPRWTFSIFIY